MSGPDITLKIGPFAAAPLGRFGGKSLSVMSSRCQLLEGFTIDHVLYQSDQGLSQQFSVFFLSRRQLLFHRLLL